MSKPGENGPDTLLRRQECSTLAHLRVGPRTIRRLAELPVEFNHGLEVHRMDQQPAAIDLQGARREVIAIVMKDPDAAVEFVERTAQIA